jgi:hypothetical protein
VPIQCEPVLSVSGHVGFSDDGKRWKMDRHDARHRRHCSIFDEAISGSPSKGKERSGIAD